MENTASSVCLECAQGWHFDCLKPVEGKECCCDDETSQSGNENVSTGVRDGMAWAKRDSAIRDRKSTGRKRAAVLFPIQPDDPCEWRNLLFAGGGLYPIMGCTNGLQKHRHHGPVILTTANVAGNLHRICDPCHRTWHVCNDGFVKEFVRSVIWLPHDPDTTAPEPLLVMANISEKIRGEMSRGRFNFRGYRKGEHDYRDMLEELGAAGEVINPWLGI